METLVIVREVAVILLAATATTLCVLATIGLVRLFPYLRHLMENLAGTTASTAKIAGDLASVSADVAADLRKTTASAAEAAENLTVTTASTAKIAGDLASVSADVAADVRKTTTSAAEASESLAEASKNILESSAYIRTALQLLELLGPAGRAANYANMGISKIPNLLRGIFRRG